jgi:hypothetical protein
MYQQIVDCHQILGRQVRPHHSEPGPIELQMRAMLCSLRLGESRGTSAERQYRTARRLVMNHANPDWKPEVPNAHQ